MASLRAALLAVGLLVSPPLSTAAQAEAWTAAAYEKHIVAIFDDIKARARSATSRAELDTLQDRLHASWNGAKPGAFLPKTTFDRLNARLGRTTSAITERWRALRRASAR